MHTNNGELNKYTCMYNGYITRFYDSIPYTKYLR